MNVALDYVATDFHITLSQANWMVLAFTIVTATTITMAAKLLERIGLHKLMTIGFVFSFVGSLLGFFAWNYPVMIVARALQAVCTGLCFPLINEALLTIAPKGKAATLLAVNSGVIGVALAFAPPVSGLIITCVGLRPLFLIPAVIALVLIIAGRPAIHNPVHAQKAHIDIPSVALSFVGLACFLYGLNEISHEVFPPLVIMLAGIAILAIFVYRQLHIDEPLLNLTPLRNPVFTVGETLVTLAFHGIGVHEPARPPVSRGRGVVLAVHSRLHVHRTHPVLCGLLLSQWPPAREARRMATRSGGICDRAHRLRRHVLCLRAAARHRLACLRCHSLCGHRHFLPGR